MTVHCKLICKNPITYSDSKQSGGPLHISFVIIATKPLAHGVIIIKYLIKPFSTYVAFCKHDRFMSDIIESLPEFLVRALKISWHRMRPIMNSICVDDSEINYWIHDNWPPLLIPIKDAKFRITINAPPQYVLRRITKMILINIRSRMKCWIGLRVLYRLRSIDGAG